MMYLGMLFTTMMYMFGASSFIIFSPEFNKGCASCNKYFSDLQRSMVTMFQVSMFQNWGEVTDAMIAEAGFSDVFVISYFYAYGIITTFVIFNVFYAMVYEIVMDWHGYNIPADASTSFLNRVFLEFLFQLLEVFLTEEDRKKFETCEETNNFTTLKLWIFYNSVKSYIRNFYARCWSPFSQVEDEVRDELIVNADDNYGTDDKPEQIDHMTELLLLVRSIDARVRAIEKKLE
jgi:hypothetical protein